MPRGRPRKHSIDQAIQVAKTLFLTHGYNGVSIAMLCEEMAITPPSLYASFGSKQRLFQQVIATYTNGLVEQLDEHLIDCQSLSEVYRNCLEFFCDFALELASKEQRCLLFCSDIFPKDSELKNLISTNIEQFQYLIQEKLEIGGLDGSTEVALALMTLISGLSNDAARDGSEEQIYTVLEFYCTALDC